MLRFSHNTTNLRKRATEPGYMKKKIKHAVEPCG